MDVDKCDCMVGMVNECVGSNPSLDVYNLRALWRVSQAICFKFILALFDASTSRGDDDAFRDLISRNVLPYLVEPASQRASALARGGEEATLSLLSHYFF